MLLPLVAFLNGLGLVLIHRLDLADEDRARQLNRVAPHGDAHVQFIWMLLGMVLFVVVLAVVRDHQHPAALHLHRAWPQALRCC